MHEGIIFHIAPRLAWDEARAAGSYRADTLESEGFIHCSGPEQVIHVANRWFAGVTGLVLLYIDVRRLTAAVVTEAADGEDERFPHVYGPIGVGDVVRVEPFEPDATGRFDGWRVAASAG